MSTQDDCSVGSVLYNDVPTTEICVMLANLDLMRDMLKGILADKPLDEFSDEQFVEVADEIQSFFGKIL